MVWFRRVVALALLAALVGCSGPSRFCDYAAGLVEDHQLTEAAHAYAEAQRLGEGSCADRGLDEVVELQADGRRSYEQGMAAARAKDLPKARASLQAALDADQGDVQAAAELRRLGQTPAVRAVPSSVTVVHRGSAGPADPLVWSGLVVALVALIFAVVAWRRRLNPIAGEVPRLGRTVDPGDRSQRSNKEWVSLREAVEEGRAELERLSRREEANRRLIEGLAEMSRADGGFVEEHFRSGRSENYGE
jgi:hypothetical protein